MPASMHCEAPPGIFIRTASTDYLYFRQGTTPFHRAHIVAALAAHVLADHEGTAGADRRLVPEVSAQLVQLILGQPGARPLTTSETEAFACMVLERGGATSCPALTARRLLRRLGPLHAALVKAVPEVARHGVCSTRRGAAFRLYQQVIDMREAILALGPYRDPRIVRSATDAGRAAGMAGNELAASVEAEVLGAAIWAKLSGQAVGSNHGDVWVPDWLGVELQGEAEWLAKVSESLPVGRWECDPVDIAPSGSVPDGAAALMGHRGTGFVRGCDSRS
ncbi:MAG: DUF6545 domain-containing protein [Streptosporangiaceae bacterium]